MHMLQRQRPQIQIGAIEGFMEGFYREQGYNCPPSRGYVRVMEEKMEKAT